MELKPQKLLTEKGPLLDAHGNPASIGWSPFPVLDCNLEKANFYALRFLQPLRIKRWDYYAIFTPSHFFSFTVSDIGYMGMVFAYCIDFATNRYHEETVSTLLGKGVTLPRNNAEGESHFDNGKVRMAFKVTSQGRTLSVNWPGFDEKGLEAEISLTQKAEHESMNIVIPIEQKRFYYNRKINCMPASGWVKYQGLQQTLEPNTSLASLDWGRGVWAYSSSWVWASSSGFLQDGRKIGLNLGYGFGDNSAATENAFILEGKLHKLGQVDFTFNSQDYKQPWTMKSPDGRLDLVFTPFLERVAKTEAVILRSEVHQMFGKYNGLAVTDQGEKIEIHDLIGFAEEHHARW